MCGQMDLQHMSPTLNGDRNLGRSLIPFEEETEIRGEEKER